MERELSAILEGRRVDLRTAEDLSRYFRDDVLKRQRFSMHKDDQVRLRHMLDAAREVMEFTKSRTRTSLDTDRMLVLSLVKEIEIIGEAANQVSETTRDLTPAIPWADIISMRNRLVHAYFDINLEILWKTVQDDLPPLIAALEDVLER